MCRSSEMLDYANEMFLVYNPKEPPYNDEGGVDPLSDNTDHISYHYVAGIGMVADE